MERAVELLPVLSGGVARIFPYWKTFRVCLCGRAGQKIWTGQCKEGGVFGRTVESCQLGALRRKEGRDDEMRCRTYHELLGQPVTAESAFCSCEHAVEVSSMLSSTCCSTYCCMLSACATQHMARDTVMRFMAQIE